VAARVLGFQYNVLWACNVVSQIGTLKLEGLSESRGKGIDRFWGRDWLKHVDDGRAVLRKGGEPSACTNAVYRPSGYLRECVKGDKFRLGDVGKGRVRGEPNWG